MNKNTSKGVSVSKVDDQAQTTVDPTFVEIATLIHASKESAFLAVNSVLVDLYWRVGEYISRKLAAAEWGDGVVTQLATYLAATQPGLRGSPVQTSFGCASSTIPIGMTS